MFVVDASITLAWCFADESTEATDAVLRRLLTEGGLAPAHWPLEVANALHFGERRGRIDTGALDEARSLLAELPVEVVPDGIAAAIELSEPARRFDLSVYDAAYLGLAADRGLALATRDARLADACRAAGVPLVEA